MEGGREEGSWDGAANGAESSGSKTWSVDRDGQVGVQVRLDRPRARSVRESGLLQVKGGLQTVVRDTGRTQGTSIRHSKVGGLDVGFRGESFRRWAKSSEDTAWKRQYRPRPGCKGCGRERSNIRRTWSHCRGTWHPGLELVVADCEARTKETQCGSPGSTGRSIRTIGSSKKALVRLRRGDGQTWRQGDGMPL